MQMLRRRGERSVPRHSQEKAQIIPVKHAKRPITTNANCLRTHVCKERSCVAHTWKCVS